SEAYPPFRVQLCRRHGRQLVQLMIGATHGYAPAAIYQNVVSPRLDRSIAWPLWRRPVIAARMVWGSQSVASASSSSVAPSGRSSSVITPAILLSVLGSTAGSAGVAR